MNARDRADVGARLKRIAGQVAGIQRMVDEGRPPPDVITQVNAIRSALGGVTSLLLTAHIEERANDALALTSPRERRELVSELVRLVQRRNP